MAGPVVVQPYPVAASALVASLPSDVEACDLLIVLGTSLAVGPFNQLVAMAPPFCPRVLVNRDPAGLSLRAQPDADCSRLPGGFDFASPARRDVFLQGDCDDMVSKQLRLCSPRLGRVSMCVCVCV